MAPHRLFQRVSHLLQLALTPDKPGQAASPRQLEMGPQPSRPEHLMDFDRRADALNGRRSQIAQLEITVAEFGGGLADCNRAGWRDRFHPRSQIRRMANQAVLDLATGLAGVSDDLAGMHPNTRFERWLPLLRLRLNMGAQLLLHLQRGIESTLGMILICDRRAEQGEDTVAGGSHQVARSGGPRHS